MITSGIMSSFWPLRNLRMMSSIYLRKPIIIIKELEWEKEMLYPSLNGCSVSGCTEDSSKKSCKIWDRNGA